MAEYIGRNRTEDVGRREDGWEIIEARSTSESEPQYIIPTGDCDAVLTYCKYDGTVSACNLRIWYYSDETWYQGAATDDGDALTGTNEARLWDVSRHAFVGFTVDSIAGGGTVAVRVEGVR